MHLSKISYLSWLKTWHPLTVPLHTVSASQIHDFIKFQKVSVNQFSSLFRSLWVTFMPSHIDYSAKLGVSSLEYTHLIPHNINKKFGPIIDTQRKTLLTDLQLDFVPVAYYFWIPIASPHSSMSPEVSS